MSMNLLMKVVPVIAVLLLLVNNKFPVSHKKRLAAGVTVDKSFEWRIVRALKDEEFNYVQIDSGTGKRWVALPARHAAFEVGSQVRGEGKRIIEAFESKALGMAFEEIVVAAEAHSYG